MALVVQIGGNPPRTAEIAGVAVDAWANRITQAEMLGTPRS
jgi:hypothetical protein